MHSTCCDKIKIRRTSGVCIAPYYGPFDAIAVELEFADVAEMEQGWADWFASERGRQFMEQWVKFVEPDGTNEVFLLQ